jgi:hypothetical protein
MIESISTTRLLIAFGLPLGLLTALILIMKCLPSSEVPGLNLAVTVDLLITVPLVYFLLIRSTTIPKFTVLPMVIVGLIIGYYLLPKEGQSYLELFKSWVLPLLELGILVAVIVKVRSIIGSFKNERSSSSDFYTALKIACHQVLPNRVAMLFATEIAVIYYGFINYSRRSINKNEFTYHKKSGTQALLGGLILVIGIESLALHFLLSIWSNTAAWIFTAIGVYTAIQMLGFARSLSQRPIYYDNNSLILRYGILSEMEISLANIQSVSVSKKNLEKNSWTRKLSPLGELESHNVLIELKTESEWTGLYGFRKKCRVIALHLDDPESFNEKVKV